MSYIVDSLSVPDEQKMHLGFGDFTLRLVDDGKREAKRRAVRHLDATD
jgi:hypothetical protein